MRQISSAALGFAVSAALEPVPATLTAADSGASLVPATQASTPPSAVQSQKLLRFLLDAHRVGSGAAEDGQKWGGTDSSAVDAANIGLAAYLIRPWIDKSLMAGVTDLVRFEAERYLLTSPRMGSDTDACANAASAGILTVEGSLFATNRARQAYSRRAATFLGRVLTTASDAPDGANPTLFPDLTMQYGGLFSASAQLQVIGALGQCGLCYRLSGDTPPPQLEQHVTECWQRLLVKLSVGGGWFLGINGGVVAGGPAVSWLATAFNDPIAQVLDDQNLGRLSERNPAQGEVTMTALTLPAIGQLAYQCLFYGYFPPPSGGGAVTPAAVSRTLAGVTWLPAAAYAVHRTLGSASSFSWTTGAGQIWVLSDQQHLQWKIAPNSNGGATAGMADAPAWNVEPDGFSTLGALRMDSGAHLESGVCSLPDGTLALFEHDASGSGRAGISLTRDASREPDMFRDDEVPGRPPGPVRWANVDNNLGMVVAQGAIRFMAPAGAGSDGAIHKTWPVLTTAPDVENRSLVLLYPEANWITTRALASRVQELSFDGPGWFGAVVPASTGEDYLLVGRFGGSTAAMARLTTIEGAPVLAEDAALEADSESVQLSSPAGAMRWESVSCWLSVSSGGTASARQGREPASIWVTGTGGFATVVTARFIGTGRPAVLSSEDGRTIVHLPPRIGRGQMHFYLRPGRTMILRY